MDSDSTASGENGRRFPRHLPIFPLSKALLLPGCRLPLNIFEPRYLQLVDDAIEGDGLIGMIQPAAGHGDEYEPPLQGVGCAGRITSVKETEDGRYLIHLVGTCRFEVVQEVATDKLYRLVEVSWDRFRSDLHTSSPPRIDREELVSNLRAYFDARGLEANWDAIDESDNGELVNSLAMVCPFDNSEKQALLEAGDLEERGKLVIALMNMSLLYGDHDSTTLH